MGQGCTFTVFAVRESVHEALGFSPFELVFGHVPWGPLKLLKEACLDTDLSEDVITRVLEVRHRLMKATAFAQKNLRAAQEKMKTWYNRKAHSR